MSALLRNARSVLEEFITDVEAVGPEEVSRDWPDILSTYHRAKTLIGELRSLDVPEALRLAAISAVKIEYCEDGRVEVDNDAMISIGSDGVYVSLWGFVYPDVLKDHGYDMEELAHGGQVDSGEDLSDS